MKRFWSIILTALMIGPSFALGVYAQDDLITVKNKGGVTIIKDKTKPVLSRVSRRRASSLPYQGVEDGLLCLECDNAFGRTQPD